MVTKESIHGGHRKRMIEKVINNRDAFVDHEILEVLLYKYIPRKDTNEIAHRLLRTFGSIEKIFSASPKDLQVVEGIGKKVSAEICVLGKIYQIIYENKIEDKKQNWTSFDKNKEEIIKFFDGMYEEKLLIILLDEKYNKINQLVYKSQDFTMVNANSIDIVNAIVLHKPKNIIIAHNHPSGTAEPSETDDITTQKLNFICSLHGVNLLDHIIVAKNKAYSYHIQNRIQYIKEISDISKIITKIRED